MKKTDVSCILQIEEPQNATIMGGFGFYYFLLV